MLWWALAAAIPILLHVWRRRYYRRMDWAAMEFLERAVRQTTRRLRMRNLLLLAVRVLTLLVLALALADPRVASESTDAAAARRPQHQVIVLDASYSMGLLQQDISRFELAKQHAMELVRRSADGDAFSIVWMGQPSRSLIGQPSYDRAAVVDEIQRIACGQGGADLEQTLQLVEQLVQQGRQNDEKRPPLELCQVTWFTDLRRNTWDAVRASRVAQRARQLSELARLVIVDVGAPVDSNLVVTDLRTPTGFVTAGQEVPLQATIENVGSDPVVDVPVELLVEGRAVARRTVQLAAHSTQVVTMPHRFPAAGDQRIEVRLPQDSLPLDSQRFLSLPVRSTTRALCVEGRDRSARYVALALQPDAAVAQPITATRISATSLRSTDLAPYDAVFLCNVDSLTEADASELRTHLARGGGLIVLIGEARAGSALQSNTFRRTRRPAHPAGAADWHSRPR